MYPLYPLLEGLVIAKRCRLANFAFGAVSVDFSREQKYFYRILVSFYRSASKNFEFFDCLHLREIAV